MRSVFILFTLLLVSIACNQSGSDNNKADQQPAVVPQTQASTLPSVPLQLLERINMEGTQIDYIFYNYDFTMSLSDQASIQYAVRHIAEDPAPLKPECKPAGRVTYQIKGDIVLEGDFYFSTGCTYFVFDEQRQKKYANYMTDEGIKYFNNQIQQALQLQQKAREQAGQ